jgi:hypothetical protein
VSSSTPTWAALPFLRRPACPPWRECRGVLHQPRAGPRVRACRGATARAHSGVASRCRRMLAPPIRSTVVSEQTTPPPSCWPSTRFAEGRRGPGSSRGELVEIGGSFSASPTACRKGGARLRAGGDDEPHAPRRLPVGPLRPTTPA